MLEKIFKPTRALFLARPESAALDLVYRHPDTTVPRGAKLTVRSDEEAVFFRQGRLAGVLEAGAYVLDTANVPFLGGLVNVATGGNHYLAEVFFVRTAETPISLGPDDLGSFVDVASRNLLRMSFTGRVSLSVVDGVALVTQLGGQSSISGEVASSIVASRLRNSLRALVAERAQSLPIHGIISNALTEEFGAALMAHVGPEFTRMGVRLDRFLELALRLDGASEEMLRRHQSREADLVIDAKGAQLAADPGFATYNAVKGGRSVAEGLGSGLGKGLSGPLIGMGFGYGLGPAVPGAGVGGRGPSPAEGAAAAGVAAAPRRTERFHVQSGGGPEGPYVARQVALWLIARGVSPEAAQLRGEADPPDLWYPASSEASVMLEYRRRSTQAVQVSAAVAAPPVVATPERRMTLFAYWNGEREERDLTAGEVAERVRANPSGANLVWTEGFADWKGARDVPEIEHILARTPPPPPR